MFSYLILYFFHFSSNYLKKSTSYITFDEFKLFEELLCSPDNIFKFAFQLFDTRGVGLITFGKHLFFLFLLKPIFNAALKLKIILRRSLPILKLMI